jgi:hypothetical protein
LVRICSNILVRFGPFGRGLIEGLFAHGMLNGAEVTEVSPVVFVGRRFKNRNTSTHRLSFIGCTWVQ